MSSSTTPLCQPICSEPELAGVANGSAGDPPPGAAPEAAPTCYSLGLGTPEDASPPGVAPAAPDAARPRSPRTNAALSTPPGAPAPASARSQPGPAPAPHGAKRGRALVGHPSSRRCTRQSAEVSGKDRMPQARRTLASPTRACAATPHRGPPVSASAVCCCASAAVPPATRSEVGRQGRPTTQAMHV